MNREARLGSSGSDVTESAFRAVRRARSASYPRLTSSDVRRWNAFAGSSEPILRGSTGSKLQRTLLLARPAPVDDAGDQIRRDPRGGQLPGHGTPARQLVSEGVLRHLPGERLIIDQAYPFQPIEDIADLICLETRLEQSPLQLPAAAGTDGEETERALVTAPRMVRPA